MDVTGLACLFWGSTVLFFAGLWLAPGGIRSLARRAGGEHQVDVGLSYDARTLYRLLDAYGEDGRHQYRRILGIDLVFPLVYGTTVCLTALWLGASTHPVAGLMAPAIAVAALADWAEDLLLLLILRLYPVRRDDLARRAAIATRIKMLAIGATGLLTLFALIGVWSKLF